MSAEARARLAARLSSDYANGGHRSVFVPDLVDVADVGSEAAANAASAILAAAQAEAALAEAQDLTGLAGDVLGDARPEATTLTGVERALVYQDAENRRTTIMDFLRLSSAKHAGLVFDSRVQAIALVAALSLPLNTIIATGGYAAPGDGGDATYCRVASEPSHDGKFNAGGWWELKSNIIRPEMLGAAADGATDDTAECVSANGMLRPGQTLVLTAGKTYCVTEYIFRDLRSGGQLNGAGLVCYDGSACLKKIGSAGTHLAATESWLQASPGSLSQYWPYAEGIVFDANGLADYAYAGTAWRAKFVRCTFTGGLIAGTYLPHTTKAGITVTGSHGNNVFLDCQWKDNTGSGILSTQYEDVIIDGGFSASNGGYGVDAEVGGWRVIGFKSYGNTLGPFRATKFGYGSVFIGGHFDLPGEFWINGIQTTGGTGRLSDCDFKCGLKVTGSSGIVVINSPRFQTDSGHLLMGTTGTAKVIVQGGIADVSNPIRWTSSTGGVLEVEEMYLAAHGGYLSGLLAPPPAALLEADTAPTDMRFRKTLAAGTETTIVIDLTLPNSNQSASLLSIDLGATTYQNSFADYETYQARVRAGVTRRADNSIRGDHAVVREEDASGTSGISAAVAWSFAYPEGTSSDLVATLTITLTHVAPTSAANTMFMAKISAVHRLVTAMTVA